jgi:hypothetical protein
MKLHVVTDVTCWPCDDTGALLERELIVASPTGRSLKKAERLILARRCDCRSAFDLFDRLSRPL